DGRIVLSDYLHATVSLLDPVRAKVTLLAGAYDVPGFMDGAADIARFSGPYGVAVTPGDPPMLIVADYNNDRVREIGLDGTTATIAGDGAAAFGEGPAASAHFNHPVGIAIDAAGTIYLT